jgi:hypothetical protein
MKWHLFPIASLLVLSVSCGEEENLNLEAYNTGAFVFDIGDEFEVNAAMRIRGFKLEEEGDEFSSSVSYEVDLVKPDGTTEESLLSKVEDFRFRERVNDTGLDIQFNLDKTYGTGRYTLHINLIDNYTHNTTSASAEFELVE